MTIEDHVKFAIDDYQSQKFESALMHACFAIEGTARNLYKKDPATRKDYKACLREYYWIIEPMIGGGINLDETPFTNLKIDNGHGKQLTTIDLADVIYHIFRCSLGHCKSIPLKYKLRTTVNGFPTWSVGNNELMMPDCIIWALLAVSVFSKTNSGIKTKGDYFLSYGLKKFIIKDWWGKEDDFKKDLSNIKPNPIRVKLEGLDKIPPGSNGIKIIVK